MGPYSSLFRSTLLGLIVPNLLLFSIFFPTALANVLPLLPHVVAPPVPQSAPSVTKVFRRVRALRKRIDHCEQLAGKLQRESLSLEELRQLPQRLRHVVKMAQ